MIIIHCHRLIWTLEQGFFNVKFTRDRRHFGVKRVQLAQTLAYHAKRKISQFSFQSSLDCISAKAELFKLCVGKSLIAMLIYVSGLGMLSEVWMDNGLAKRRQ